MIQGTACYVDPEYEHRFNRCGGPDQCSHCKLRINESELAAHENKICNPKVCYWCRGGDILFKIWLEQGPKVHRPLYKKWLKEGPSALGIGEAVEKKQNPEKEEKQDQ